VESVSLLKWADSNLPMPTYADRGVVTGI